VSAPAIWIDGRRYDVCARGMTTDSTRQQVAVELAVRAVARTAERRWWKAARNLWSLIQVVFFASACAVGPQRAGLFEGEHALSETKASPMSVGPMLAVVVPLKGDPVRPAELLGGTVRINASGRAVNAMVFGGFASKSFATPAEGGLAGGLGASVELTPGNLLYSVDLGGGVVFGDFGPAACLGVTIQSKM
jgi:hypothetical protein